VTLLGSVEPWALCTTTGCDDLLQGLSERSRIDLGHGVVTAMAAILASLSASTLFAADEHEHDHDHHEHVPVGY
jgi:hypothetical protein